MTDDGRRDEAIDRAARLLQHRDHTTAAIAAKLEARGIGETERAEALDILTRAGIVDDERYAHRRAAALADRGLGDAAVLDRLERDGVPIDLAHDAIASLPPERDRARAVYDARGGGVAALRALASRGFAEESLEALVARHEDSAIG